MKKDRFTVISSFARDVIQNSNTSKTQTLKGGPAFWVTRVLKDLEVTYQVVTSQKQAVVHIMVKDGEETGTIVRLDPIIFSRKMQADMFLISTIGNEFPLESIQKLDGFIALDIQGYARTVGRKTLVIPERIGRKIDVLKVTSRELTKLSSGFIVSQKKRILIITKGAQGFEVFVKGKKYQYSAKKIDTPEKIGAGDVLLAAFLVKFRQGVTVQDSALFAQQYVEAFIKSKGNS